MKLITDPQEQGEAAAMMARVMWPETEWVPKRIGYAFCVLGLEGTPDAFHPFHSLDDCHDAAMWLKDNDVEKYEAYKLAVVEWRNEDALNRSLLDAPASVRASALAVAFEGIGGE